MLLTNRLGSFKVGDGPGHLEDTGVGPGREAELFRFPLRESDNLHRETLKTPYRRFNRSCCLHETTCLMQSGESVRGELTSGETGHISIKSAG